MKRSRTMLRIVVIAAAVLAVAIMHEGSLLAEEEPAGIVIDSPEDVRRKRVYATIGKETITVGELEDEINRRSPFVRRRFEEPEALRKFVDDQVEAEILSQGALLRGYDKDPNVQRFVGETIAQMFIRAEFDEKIKPEDVPNAEVKKYFKEHPEQFSSPEMRRASHILVASKQEAADLIDQLTSADAETSAKLPKNESPAAATKTHTGHQRVSSGAKMFTELAKEKSLDTETKLRGGDLLFFDKDGQMSGGKDAPVDKSLVKAAFRLKQVGNISKSPVAVGGKWSVVKLTGMRKAQRRTLKEADATIRRRIWRQQRRDALEQLLAELEAELKPEKHPERVDPIKLPKSGTGSSP